MPLFCLRRPEEWWGILQVCTRLSHLQPKRSIVQRLHMKFQEVWHFVSQTPANKNKPKIRKRLRDYDFLCSACRCFCWFLIFRQSRADTITNRRIRRNKYFLDEVLKDWKSLVLKKFFKDSNIVHSKTLIEKWQNGWIRRWRKRKFRHTYLLKFW